MAGEERMAVAQRTTYRVFVDTDLGGDPDDIQSLVHLLHYTDILRLEGLTSCTGPGSDNSTAKIREWVLRTDLDHLRRNGYPELMAEDEVLNVLRQGAIDAGAPSAERSTAASKWLSDCAKREDPEGRGRPLWVLVWGSLTNVAQALHDCADIAAGIRVYSIGSSNTTHDPAARDFVYHFMEERCPRFWWIENGILPRFSRDTFRGYYSGGDQSGIWGNQAFIHHVIRGRGTTRQGMFSTVLGDAFPVADWPEGTLKEGDSPTFTYLLAPVVANVGNVNDPTVPSWGGQFAAPEPSRFPNYFTDLPLPAADCQRTINRWRVDYLRHWKLRWERYGGTA